MTAHFELQAHPTLVGLDDRLPELAGMSAYSAGCAYVRGGAVRDAAVAGATAFASVTGTTDYRVSLSFEETLKPSCTCPAHRRNRWCKHVVALCVSLLAHPAEFAVLPAAPAAPPKTERAPRVRRQAKPATAALQSSGLETLDRLIADLADGGLASLGGGQQARLAEVGELVRSRKLRRLGALLVQLEQAARAALKATAPASQPVPTHLGVVPWPQPWPGANPPAWGNSAAGRSPTNTESGFADLLVDLHRTRLAVEAHFGGRAALDPRLAEELVGKTWRDADLETVRDLELVEVAYERETDAEFQTDSSYLVDLASGQLYVERQITPRRLRTAAKPRHRARLQVTEAGLYPGPPPRRLKLRRVAAAPLLLEHVDRVIARASTSVPDLRAALLAHLADPFASPTLPVLVRPAALVTDGARHSVLDSAGAFLSLGGPALATQRPELLSSVVPESGRYALCGRLELGAEGLRLRLLSVLGQLADGTRFRFPDD